MKIETTPREDHQIEMLVEVEPERMEAARRRAARKIAEKGKIPGFRPGKAPYDVVRRFYGDPVITEEAVELLVDEIYPKALDEAQIKPAAAGQLENIESIDPPKFKFVVPLAPTVDLGDYRSVRLDYTFEAPGPEKVDEAIKDLRQMYGTTETVERAVQEGDYVMVDVKAFQGKGKEAVESLTRENFPFMVRPEERETDWPFPGFGQHLIGSAPGQTAEFKHKFPKDHAEEELQGKTVNFEATVKLVRGVTLPELDDSFAQMVGQFENVEALKKALAESVEKQARDEYEDKYFSDVLEQIKAGASIKYASQSLEHETDHVVEELKRRLADQRMDYETYLKVREMDEARFRQEEAAPVARRRLERSLVLDEISRAEQIALDEESLKAAFSEQWARLAATDEEFARRTKGGTRASKELLDAVAFDAGNRLMVQRVLERIKLIATGQAPETGDGSEKPAAEAKPRKKAAKKAPETGDAEKKTVKRKTTKKEEEA